MILTNGRRDFITVETRLVMNLQLMNDTFSDFITRFCKYLTAVYFVSE